MSFDDVRLKGFSSRIRLNEAIQRCITTYSKFPVEEISLKTTSLTNRILAENIYSVRSIPPFDRSAVDGYAVRSEDTIGASEATPVVLGLLGEIEIGHTPSLEVSPKTAVQIPTGGMVPKGADSVIMIEDTSVLSKKTSKIEIYKSVRPYENVSPVGEDFHRNDLLMKKGRKLKVIDRSFLLSAGLTTIKVSRSPRIAIFSTGNELVDAWETDLEPGKIPDVNSINLYESCVNEGWLAEIKGRFSDNEMELRKTLVEITKSDYDIVLVSGGSSVGKKDLLPVLFNELGEIIFHGIAMRPGGPMSAAKINNKVIFGLPGFPTATLIAYNFVVKPVIYSLMGLKESYSFLTVNAKVTRNVGSKLGRLDFLRVKLEKNPDSGEYLATPLQIGGSGTLKSLIDGTGIIMIPESSEGLKKGDLVKTIILETGFMDFNTTKK